MSQNRDSRIQMIVDTWRAAGQTSDETDRLPQERVDALVADMNQTAFKRAAALTNDLTVIRAEARSYGDVVSDDDDDDGSDTEFDAMLKRQELIDELLDLDAADTAFELIADLPDSPDDDNLSRDTLYQALIENLARRHYTETANQVIDYAFAANGHGRFKARLAVYEHDRSAECLAAVREALPHAVAATQLIPTNPVYFWAQIYALSGDSEDLKRARDVAKALVSCLRARAFKGVAKYSADPSDYIEAFSACRDIESEEERVHELNAILSAISAGDMPGRRCLSARDRTQLAIDLKRINPRWSRALVKHLSGS